jgi:hypothetical protein
MKKITLLTFLACNIVSAYAGFDSAMKPASQLPMNKALIGQPLSSTYFSGTSLLARPKSFHIHSGDAGDAFQEGKIVFSVGYGFPNWGATILKTFDNNRNFEVTGFGPLHFRGEYGLSDKIGFGLSVNYVSFAASWVDDINSNGNNIPYYYKVSSTSISFLARMNIHFATSEKLDPFWGLGVGYRSGSYKITSDDPNANNTVNLKNIVPVGFETTIGLRYYFIPGFGLYTEMGIAKSLIQAGLTVAL